ncbi:MAG: pitrilysin family protein [Gammaproteobacteria bacterium]|jgi:zinc protease
MTFIALPCFAQGSTINTHKYQLDNGLTLIVRPDHRAPIATMQVWYKVGSAYETNGRTGLSHFLEHMMFKGTKNNPGKTFNDTIYSLGGQLNAFAYFDYTGYWQTLPAKYLEAVFVLEADRMQHLIVDDETIFEKEKQVILEERRLRVDDQPISLAYERYLATAFDSSPYRILPIGWQADIAATTLADVKNWYDTWYAPNNATVVVIGDVNPDEVYALAQKYFGDIEEKTLPALKPQPEIKPLGQKRITVKVPATLPYIIMGFHVPVLNSSSELWEPAALTVLSSILDGGQSARFSRELIRNQRIASVASTDYDPFFRDANLFTISAVPAADIGIYQLEAALLEQIAILKQTLVSEQELDRARKQLMAYEIYKLDSIDAQASEIGSLESVGLPWDMGNEFLQELLVITPEQIQQVAQKYLNPEYMTVTILQPQPIQGEVDVAQQ